MKSFFEWLESTNAIRFKGYKRKPFSLEKELKSYEPEIEPEDNDEFPSRIGPLVSGRHLSDEDVDIGYDNYYNAMGRKRSGTQLPWDSFRNYVTQYDIYHLKHRNSTVYGQMYDDIFVPSHFAPNSLREGRELMMKLKNINSALMVPEDLSKMALRVGFQLVKENVPAFFRGEIILKNILASNNYVARKIEKYLTES